ncbi:acyl transferase/acyl hydrolase/lysophospholipase, partial [Rhizoctonia solani]
MRTQQISPLRLLSFDGGGVRGLSSLFILKEFLRRTRTGSGGNQPIPLPCECFDMICGTGTGGLIAIMLGKLCMSVDDTIDEYIKLLRTIASNKKWPWKRGRYSARALERAVNLIIGGRARDLGWPEAAINEGLQLTTEDIGR